MILIDMNFPKTCGDCQLCDRAKLQCVVTKTDLSGALNVTIADILFGAEINEFTFSSRAENCPLYQLHDFCLESEELEFGDY